MSPIYIYIISSVKLPWITPVHVPGEVQLHVLEELTQRSCWCVPEVSWLLISVTVELIYQVSQSWRLTLFCCFPHQTPPPVSSCLYPLPVVYLKRKNFDLVKMAFKYLEKKSSIKAYNVCISLFFLENIWWGARKWELTAAEAVKERFAGAGLYLMNS